MNDKKIRVVVIDDSPTMRALLAKIVSNAPDLEVAGTAPDAIVAQEVIRNVRPDVLTLDIEMPHMNGLEFLEKIMRERPIPVIIIAGEQPHRPDLLPKSVRLGAFDFLAKPNDPWMIVDYAEMICEKIRAAYAARHRLKKFDAKQVSSTPPRQPLSFSGVRTNTTLIAIGTSTGGPEALQTVLPLMPTNLPPIVIVQHMPKNFVSAFVHHLNQDSSIHVREAVHGQTLESGSAYISPGGVHLKIASAGIGFKAHIEDTEPVNRHKPSVDALFDSVAKVAGARATGIILTGMGKDGAQGLLKMKEQGSMTFGQDQASCVVYGMPREAALIGAVKEVVPLNMVVPRLLEYLSGRK